MNFVTYPDPRLARKADPIAEVDDALRAIGHRLVAAAVEARAYGLAATHIGEIAPAIVLNTTPDADTRSDLVFYNPRVIASAPEGAPGIEGSVSMPGIEVEIVRPVWVEVACEDEEGRSQAFRFDGFVARCAFHEIDQMNGIFFLNRLSRLKRDMAIRRFEKLRR